MNLTSTQVSATYKYLLNQSGSSITLGTGQAVNWDAANVVARTGAQSINGIKTFLSDVNFNGNSNTFGAGITSTNSFGKNASINYFGDNDLVDSLSATTNSFGMGDFTNNNFGGIAEQNSFGVSAVGNDFGASSPFNGFGLNATINAFGEAATQNYFGSESSDNRFGQYGISNTFGELATGNQFGLNCPNNIYSSGRFDGPIRLNLAEFGGSKTQAGQIGEAKVSGSGLYICTGTNSWGRVFLSSF